MVDSRRVIVRAGCVLLHAVTHPKAATRTERRSGFHTADRFIAMGFVRNCRWLVTLLALACQTTQPTPSVAGTAATESGNGPFAIPTGKLLCDSYALPRSAPAGLLGYQFEDGRLTVNERVMQAAYDSTGRPVFLVVLAPERTAAGTSATHALSVSFPDNAPSTGFRVLHPEQRNDTTTEALSAPLVAQARSLAVWLWNHRCNQQ